MEALFAKASTPFYEGFLCNMLVTMLLLLNLGTTHGIANTFMNELFSFLQKNDLSHELNYS
jgi:formate/nitrite transporter FocA (FNT family)